MRPLREKLLQPTSLCLVTCLLWKFSCEGVGVLLQLLLGRGRGRRQDARFKLLKARGQAQSMWDGCHTLRIEVDVGVEAKEGVARLHAVVDAAHEGEVLEREFVELCEGGKPKPWFSAATSAGGVSNWRCAGRCLQCNGHGLTSHQWPHQLVPEEPRRRSPHGPDPEEPEFGRLS